MMWHKVSFVVFAAVMSIMATASFVSGADYSVDQVIGFTDYLVEKKEYSRAANELEVFLSRHNDYSSERNIMFRLDFLYMMSSAGENNPQVFQSDFAPLFRADVFLWQGDYNGCAESLDQAAVAGLPARAIENRRLALCLLARQECALPDNQDILSVRNMLQDEYRQPWLAVASGLFPGGGYIYAGNIATGIVTMIVSGICFGYGYWAWKEGFRPLALTGFAVGTAFYGGSVVGGYREALWRNRQSGITATEELARQLGFQRDFLNEYERLRGRNVAE